MEIALIMAVDEAGGIGYKGSLPKWNMKDDLDFFKRVTMNNTVIMGSTTYTSLPKSRRPLEGRFNIVLSRNPRDFLLRSTNESTTLEEIANKNLRITSETNLKKLCSMIPDCFMMPENNKIFVIGGSQIFDLFSDDCNAMYVSYIKGTYESDIRLDVNRYVSRFTHSSVLVEDSKLKIVKYWKNA